MKPPFLIEVPNFRREFLEEEKPVFFNRLTEAEQEEYTAQQINNRMNVWSCMIAARAYNIAMILCAVVIVTGGAQLWQIIQHVAGSLLGIK